MFSAIVIIRKYDAVTDDSERAARDKRLLSLEAALLATKQDNQAFTSKLCHDLKSHLRAMCTFSEALSEDYADVLDDTGREYLGYIADGAQSMSRMIDALQVYNRLGAGPLSCAMESLDDIVSTVTAGMASGISASGALIYIDKPLWDALISRAGFELALQHVLDNALRFAAAGTPPYIRIAASGTSEGVTLSVTDNGIGIEPEQCERIFEIFLRLNPYRDTQRTGIGLAIVRKVMTLHGGTVTASPASGGGTTFALFMPAKTED